MELWTARGHAHDLYVCCSDGRTQPEVGQRILRLGGRFEPICRPGGIWHITRPEFRSAMIWDMAVLIKRHPIERVHLWAHTDCAVYNDLHFRGQKPQSYEEEVAFFVRECHMAAAILAEDSTLLNIRPEGLAYHCAILGESGWHEVPLDQAAVGVLSAG